MSASLVAPFAAAVADHPARLRRLVADGNRLAGYFCMATPVEVVEACGFVPIRISGGPGPVTAAGSLLPDFICPFMKRAVEWLADGGDELLSVLIQGHGCDASCGVVSILAERMPERLAYTLPLPYNDTAEGRRFMRSALQDLVERLTASGGAYSAERLEKALTIQNNIHKRLAHLFALRRKRRLALSASDFYYVLAAGERMPPVQYDRMLEDLLAEAALSSPAPAPGVPILVSGSLIESPEVFRCIEESGGTVVADDLCSGERGLLPEEPDSGQGPLERVVQRHFNRLPCASRTRAEERLPYLLQLAEQAGARGALFLLQKFCTPHLADIPYLTAELKRRGIPGLTVELDEHWQPEGGMRTRLESFFEMLS